MPTVVKLAGLFWTFAEIAIVLFLRGGIRSALGKNRGQPAFLTACILSAVLVGLMFRGDRLIGWAAGPGGPADLALYRQFVWSFFCTLWVVLEGTIAIYVLRILGLLKGATGTTPDARRRSGIRCTAALLGLATAFLLLYAYYHGCLLAFRRMPGVELVHVRRVATFYIKICGVFWIVFDGIVAVVGAKTYRILRRSGSGA